MQRSTQDTRRWAFYSLGAQMCRQDTGLVHGPESFVRWESRVLREHLAVAQPPKREFQRCVVVPADVERCMWEV